MTTSRWQPVVGALAALLALGVLAATVYRIHYGVDFTDESFYIAMALRFARRDRPFIDEANLTQTAALLTLPLVRFWVKWHHGGTEGIVRFMRLVYVAIQVGAATAAFFCLRRVVPAAVAVLAALIPVAVIPYNNPAPCYNTIGAAGFFAGLFLGELALRAARARRRDGLLVGAGVSHGIASIAYPSLALACLFYGGLLLHQLRGRRRSIAWYAIGGVLPLLPIIPILMHAGLGGLQHAVSASKVGTHDFAKLVTVVVTLLENWPHQLVFVGAYTAVVLVTRRVPRLAAVLLLAWPILFRALPAYDYIKSIIAVAYVGLSGPFFLYGVQHRPEMRTLFFRVWLPSLVGGLVFGWTSGNEAVAVGLGLLPAATVTLVFVYGWAAEAWSGGDTPGVKAWMGLYPVAVLALLVPLQFRGPTAVYRDYGLAALNTLVPSGPFAGLYTSDERADFIRRLQKDIDRYEDRSGRIGFYYDFPAGYLFAHEPPIFSSAWTFYDIPDRLVLDADYFRRHASGSDILFKMRAPPMIPYGYRRRLTERWLDAEVASRSILIHSNDFWDVYSDREP